MNARGLQPRKRGLVLYQKLKKNKKLTNVSLVCNQFPTSQQ